MQKLIPSLAISAALVCGTAQAGLVAPASVGYEPVQEQQKVKQLMLEQLDLIAGQIEVGYAQIEWKRDYHGWELQEQIQIAKDRVMNHPNINAKAFQMIVRDFFNSMRDYHVSVLFFSTEASVLPFTVKTAADGGVFITSVEARAFPNGQAPFAVGDQIVEFDGRPVEQVLQELLETATRNSGKITDQSLAERMLTRRMGMRGDPVANGTVQIGIKRSDGTVERGPLRWIHLPEQLANPLDTYANARAVSLPLHDASTTSSKAVFERVMGRLKLQPPSLEQEAATERTASDPSAVGARNSFFPKLGKVLWKSDDESAYEAYVFRDRRGRQIGFIRIPSYTEVATEDFAEAIRFLENQTEMLVVDQFNNPGGYLFEVYALASMLTDRPLTGPLQQHFQLGHAEVLDAMSLIEMTEGIESDEDVIERIGPDILGYPLTFELVQFCRQYCQQIVAHWNGGMTLTKPLPYFGINEIQPHPEARYTKPILLLINELDFSGGDFLPAILQDSGRVITFGLPTAGAGGYITSVRYTNPVGIAEIHYTSSLAVRPNGDPVEDLGVTPDVMYQLTREDLQSGFKGLVRAIHQTIDTIDGAKAGSGAQ